MKPDLGTWITTADVARRLAVKPRTVIDMVTKGKLHPQKYQRPGVAGGAISLFDPAEVAAILHQRAVANMEVLPAGEMPAPRAAASVLRAIDGPAVPAEGRLAAIVATMQAPPRWLRYDEAVIFTGLGKSRLEELVSAGQVKTDRGPKGCIVLWRPDLEKL
jgi:hypothetical protein